MAERPQRTQCVIFTFGEARHAVALAAVLRVIPMVAITPLPGASSMVMGMISVHGEPIPVVDLRRRLGLVPGMYGVDSHLLIGSTARRTVAIVVDQALGVEEIDAPSAVDHAFVESRRIAGVATLRDGLVVIHDLEALLSAQDDRAIEDALETSRVSPPS